jgi:hypothetical protein
VRYRAAVALNGTVWGRPAERTRRCAEGAETAVAA